MTLLPVLHNMSGLAAFLCYHSVVSNGPPFLSITPERFRSHLAVLRRKGWTTGTEATLSELASGGRPSAPAAFLTFDDGYLDNYELAFPLLREYGFGGFVFIVPDLVDAGGPIAWPGVEQEVAQYPQVMRSMTWQMVEEMAEHGVVFGSHTRRHPHLPQISDEQLRDELLTSRRAIEARLGSCATLAYPFGECDDRVRDAARDAGYTWAFSLPHQGPRDVDELAIPRISVDHRDDARRFAAKLHPAARAAILHPVAHRIVRLGARGAGRLQRVVRGS